MAIHLWQLSYIFAIDTGMTQALVYVLLDLQGARMLYLAVWSVMEVEVEVAVMAGFLYWYLQMPRCAA